MDNRQKTVRWSYREIKFIKFGFLSGIPIKILAQQIGRSPSALNKALSRYHIRNNETFGKNKCPVRKKRPMETSMDFVIQFLNSNGYNVCKRPFHVGAKYVCEYFINQQPVAPARLIVIANGLRLEERRSIFLVKEHDIENFEYDEKQC
ncbi:MAG: hypothetical protein LBJ89_01595 [Holosporales bacterium]|nr:hypothetical protein [Holosporales bacterium]